MLLEVLFGKIQRIQIQVYHQTSFDPKYGAFYLNNEVSVHGLVLLDQLSWRVASSYLSWLQLRLSTGLKNTERIRALEDMHGDSLGKQELDGQTDNRLLDMSG